MAFVELCLSIGANGLSTLGCEQND